jgi:hypothetical protein
VQRLTDHVVKSVRVPWLLFVWLALGIMLSGCATTERQAKLEGPGIFVRATGEAFTKAQALDQAFREAVQQATGVVMSSQQQVVNNQLARDEILSYSSGFIVSHEVVREQTLASGRYRVEINALISSAKLAERLLSGGPSQRTVGAQTQQIYGQISSLLQERQSGDALLLSLAREFPKNSFTIEVAPPKAEVSAQRSTRLVFPVTIRWAKGYLEAFEATVKYIARDRCILITEADFYRCPFNVRVVTGFWDSSQLWGYQLADAKQVDLMLRQFPMQIGLALTLYRTGGANLGRYCFTLDLSGDRSGLGYSGSLLRYSRRDRIELFNPTYKTSATFNVDNINSIKDLNTVEAELVRVCQ